MGRTFSLATEEEWKCRADGIVSFKMPTMQHGTLQNEDILHEGYRPKMLLYALDELFYIYDQVKHQRGVDERLVVAYEILGLAALCCTEQQHGLEKQGMPDAPSLLNINDATTLNAFHGWCMMGHCWWGGDLSYLGTASGAPCWQAPSNTFTGAVMMQPTVCRIQ